MTEVLGRLGPKIVLDEDAKQLLPLLNLQPAGSSPAKR
jgi:hypothetical protein